MRGERERKEGYRENRIEMMRGLDTEESNGEIKKKVTSVGKLQSVLMSMYK